MCGIFGRFARNGALGNLDELCRATNLLFHRGPDDGAWWADDAFFLGHRRLSIIDLSTGGQPMATADARYVIVFNGEIYNYKELREELAAEGSRFDTTSDTEVILHGYRRWGTELPKHLIGMFAFAIVDRLDRSLFVARDRFGEKPLLIRETPESVDFASELNPLVQLSGTTRRIELEALAEYLSLNYVPGDRTLVQGVRRLPPGAWRLYRRADTVGDFYWRPPAESGEGAATPTLSQATDELGERLDRSIRMALRADVPITLFLSGGIDSSSVAESAARLGIVRHAYCLDFAESGFSELPNAERVAKKLGLELRRVVLSADNLSDFSQLVAHADDPLADSSALPVFTLAREVAKDYKVAISGDGGDELFGGYLTYKATYVHQRVLTPLPDVVRRRLSRVARLIPAGDSKVPWSYKIMRFLRAAHLPAGEAHFTWNGTWLPEDAVRLLRDPTSIATPRLSARHALSSAPSLTELQRADATDYLPNDILTKVDRMTMAHGLEARAPLLMPDVADYALGLPAHLKLTPFGQPKRILRELVKRRLGPDVSEAKKQGFSIPVHRWLRGPMRPTLESLVNRRMLDDLGVLNTDAILGEKDRHLAGKAQLGWELWGIMVLVEWYQQRMKPSPAGNAPAKALRRITLPSPTQSRTSSMECK